MTEEYEDPTCRKARFRQQLSSRYDIRVLLGEKSHSDSDFFLVVSYNCVKHGNEFFGFLGVLLVEDVATELLHQPVDWRRVTRPPRTSLVN